MRGIGVVISAMVLANVVLADVAGAEEIVLSDPKGDDKGPGTYEYPTDPVYKSGSFDLTEAVIKEDGDDVEVRVSFGTNLEDPWGSKKWDGNGFSLQMVFVFIDQKKGAGHKKALPGLNLSFDEGWEKVLILSPQGTRRLQAEVATKAKSVKDDVVLPSNARPRGRTIVARFPKAAVGGAPSKSWGFQVVVQSNEGFPDKGDLLTRKVNEFKGAHRFGGGHDFDCDPHAIDIIAGKASGAASEKDAQYKALKTYKCDDENPDGGTWATIPMVYPGG